MSAKEQKRSDSKTNTKPRSPKPAGHAVETTTTQPIHPAALVQRAELAPQSLTPRDVLHLQRTIGNQAVGPVTTAALHPTVIQRALAPGQADTLITRAGQLSTRLDQIIARLPDVVGSQVAADEFMDPIREVTNGARHNAAGVDFAPLNARLDAAEAIINKLDEIVTAHQADFDAIGSAYLAVPAGQRDALFGEVCAEFGKLGKKIAQRKISTADVSTVRRAVERAIIPDNKEIKKLRAENAQVAMDRVAMLVQAGLAEVDNLEALYASEFDAAVDHFGGSWKLKPAAGTGKMQWIREWEFHVHATVQRAAAPPNLVTGFTIHRAHIKPSSGARELGVSIQITNPALLAQVQGDNQRKIVHWSQTPDGLAVLKKLKR